MKAVDLRVPFGTAQPGSNEITLLRGITQSLVTFKTLGSPQGAHFVPFRG